MKRENKIQTNYYLNNNIEWHGRALDQYARNFPSQALTPSAISQNSWQAQEKTKGKMGRRLQKEIFQPLGPADTANIVISSRMPISPRNLSYQPSRKTPKLMGWMCISRCCD